MDRQARSGKTIVVSGATGMQGGAVARRLLDEGWRVRALTRDPAKSAAQALAQAGAEVVAADFYDGDSLARALDGAYGVYSVQNFFERGITGEIQQGKNLASAGKAARVQHFVYASVVAAERRTGIPHFDSKAEIEQFIRNLGLPCTTLRPCFFMENFRSYFPPREEGGEMVLRMPLKPDSKLSMIAVADIAHFAALAFDQPEKYLGEAIDLTGDEMDMRQAAALFQRASGKPHRFVEQPSEEMRAFSEDLALMFEWYQHNSQRADIEALRRVHPGLRTLEAWLAGG